MLSFAWLRDATILYQEETLLFAGKMYLNASFVLNKYRFFQERLDTKLTNITTLYISCYFSAFITFLYALFCHLGRL
jgi:hypothetical protein